MRSRPTRMLPPGYFLLALIAIFLLDRFAPGPAWLPPASRWVALVLVVFGFTVFVATVWLFRRNQTPLRPFQDAGTLMTGGPFRLSRNPIYLGMTLLLTSAWLLSRATTPVLVPIAFAVVIQKRFIEAEEEFLTEHFGTAYGEYFSRVRRWL